MGLTHSIALPSSSPRNPIRANQKIEGATKLESYLNLLEEVKGIFRLKKPQAVRCDSQAPVPDVSRKRSRKIESVVPEGSSRRPRCVECRSRSVDSRPVEMWISVPDVSTGQGSANSGSRGTFGPRRLGSGRYRDIRHFGNARDRGNPRVRVATKDCRGGCDRGKAVYLTALPGVRGRCAVPCNSTLQERPTLVLPVPQRRDLLGPDTTLRERPTHIPPVLMS